jgi:NAD(P)-dependent dehydrogenase (short-subunit alcohol dehydrogenase family)
MFSLKSKVAVITGGGSGIGQSIAATFARQGAQVIILERNASAAEETVSSIVQKHGLAEAIACDVSIQSQVVAAVESIRKKFRHIDILVNSAGVAKVANLENTTEEELDRLYSVNIKGTYNTMYAVVPVMKAGKKGVILNLASIAGSLGIADRFAYSMTKGAVIAMTLSVAKDYINDGIRCNCISPGRVHTPFVDGFIKANYPGREKEMFEKLSRTQPIGRMARPEEMAAFALYLCSDEAAFVTGCDYPIDGGSTKLNT